MNRIVSFLCLLATGFSVAYSADTDTSFQRLSALPIGAYSEETGVQYGAVAMVFLKPFSAQDAKSQIDMAWIRSVRAQQRIVAKGDLWAFSSQWHFLPEIDFVDWPSKYWAGGNTPQDQEWKYHKKNLRTSLLSLRKWQNWLAGFEVEGEWNRTTLPDSLELPQGGKRVALGISAQWDTRDHPYWPRHGYFTWVREKEYRNWWGSDWNFRDVSVDLRAFFPGPREGAFGVASYWQGITGSAPFDHWASPDGSYRMRGLRKGRLVDQQQWVLQSEWRLPLFWHFSGVAFAEFGKVGPDFGTLLTQRDFHPLLGIGGRMFLNQERKVNVRGDLSWVDGGLGLTIYYKEAF